MAAPPEGVLWFDRVDLAGPPRPPLPGDTRVDVCVVGAGFTGLWAAYWLLRARPALRVTVLEARVAGYGASGRNGGWCSALFPASTAALARRHGTAAALAMRRAMRDAVGEVGEVAADEGIDCGYRRGGTVVVARSRAQLARARAAVREAGRWGVDDLRLLDAGGVAAHVRVAGAVGGTFTPDCARVHPAALVRGLARAVERHGGVVAEDTRALRLAPGRVETDRGTVRCGHVLRATEAWTATLPGLRRAVAPVYSLVVATEPLPAAVWQRVGLADGQTLSEHRHLVVYAQRTADDRLVLGGRGAPYHAGSAVHPDLDRDERVFAALRATSRSMLPGIGAPRFSHAWGGPLGVPRDWHAGVGLDPATGIGWAGGYVGDGVATAYLAGRTLADLVTGATGPRTALPWVGHRSPRWEPEPLRWLGIGAGLRLAHWADLEERLTGRPALLARPLAALTGH